jgi:hypothetical protein
MKKRKRKKGSEDGARAGPGRPWQGLQPRAEQVGDLGMPLNQYPVPGLLNVRAGQSRHVALHARRHAGGQGRVPPDRHHQRRVWHRARQVLLVLVADCPCAVPVEPALAAPLAVAVHIVRQLLSPAASIRALVGRVNPRPRRPLFRIGNARTSADTIGLRGGSPSAPRKPRPRDTPPSSSASSGADDRCTARNSRSS